MLRTELLKPGVHARESFCSHSNEIEVFLKRQANQEFKRHLSETYVIVEDSKPSLILGYFTISNHSIDLESLPKEHAKKLGGYKSLGTVLLGRMGRDIHLTPKGFGEIVIKEAMKQSLARGKFYALEINAKNQELVSYYERFGFIKFIDKPLHLFMPYSTIQQLCNTELKSDTK